jgi:hypothetical protein
MNLDDLRKPFPPEAISWRVGSTTKDKTKGMALAYIDARDVQDRLDAVCGIDGWQCRYVPMHDKKTVCEIGIRIPRPDGTTGKVLADCEWVWKADGAGDSDIEAEKGALSDAFKRSAVRWGIGRYLYDLDSPWVELDTYEKNGTVFAKGIKQGEYAKLRALLAKNGKPPSSPYPSPSEHVDRATKAREWALGQIPKIKAMDRASLDAFLLKFRQQIVDLKELDTKASVEMDKAVSDRLEALFA